MCCFRPQYGKLLEQLQVHHLHPASPPFALVHSHQTTTSEKYTQTRNVNVRVLIECAKLEYPAFLRQTDQLMSVNALCASFALQYLSLFIPIASLSVAAAFALHLLSNCFPIALHCSLIAFQMNTGSGKPLT